METTSSADGTKIAYERTGSGPPLVLIHGSSVDHTTWTDSVPFLAEHFTVYAVDRRGRGESGDAEEYSIEREVKDVVAVVESIGEPVHLLGHSFGGHCSLEAALLIADLRRLVLYEPGILVEATAEDERALDEIRDAIEAGDREEALIVFYREFAHLNEAEIEHVRSLPTWSRRVEAVHTVLRETEVGFGYEFESARFRGMTTPTLLLLGEESGEGAHSEAEALRDALPDSHVVSLEGQEHIAYRIAPERFSETVIRFLTDSR